MQAQPLPYIEAGKCAYLIEMMACALIYSTTWLELH